MRTVAKAEASIMVSPCFHKLDYHKLVFHSHAIFNISTHTCMHLSSLIPNEQHSGLSTNDWLFPLPHQTTAAHSGIPIRYVHYPSAAAAAMAVLELLELALSSFGDEDGEGHRGRALEQRGGWGILQRFCRVQNNGGNGDQEIASLIWILECFRSN